MSDCLKIEDHPGNLRVLIMNIPARRNALSDEMREALRAALKSAQADPKIRAIVLAGTEGIFCAGGDIKAMGQPVPIALKRLDVLHEVVRLIALGPKPVVAAVDGVAYGAGMSLAMACDCVVATETARFCASFSRIGLAPDCGILWSLPRRVGPAFAQRILMDGRERKGREAIEIGLADVLAEGDLLTVALAQAAALVPAAPLPNGFTKSIIAQHFGDLNAVLAAEQEAQAALFLTKDHAEATAAFLEKRPPVFAGE
ncbi:MAG: enoyl-CoA hydratase/isomerase family protein [Paracoccaceae bacterium]